MRKKIRIFLLCIILFGAGWTDLTCGKVRNLWLIAGAVPGICLNGAEFLKPAVLILLPSYLFFRAGMMGAGDGKLMVLIAGYMGLDSGLWAIGTGLVIGAVWNFCRMRRKEYFPEYVRRMTGCVRRLMYLREGNIVEFEKLTVEKGRDSIPLAVCLTAGTYVYLLISCAVQFGKEMGLFL